jgi:hypothetical protein
MDQRARLMKAVEDAERELDAAKRLSELRAAAAKLNRARAELQWLDHKEKPKRSASRRGRGSAGASS